MTPSVVLTPSEMLHAAQCGAYRHVQNIRNNRPEHYGCKPEDGFKIQIAGALGEVAVAKFLGRYWVGMAALGDFKAADVLGVNVRAISNPAKGLILRPWEKDDMPFVLTLGIGPTWTLCGWILAREGKAQEFRRDPDGRGEMFIVPQARLEDMATLASFLGDRVVLR